VVGADDHALGAVPDVADVGVLRLEAERVRALRRQAAHLEDQLAVAVVVDAHLRVGRLAVVLVAEAAADAHDRVGHRVLAEAPPGLVHLMDALVAEVAVAVFPLPVPVVVQVLAHQRPVRRRAAPQVVVDAGRDRLRAAHLADRAARLVAQAAGQLHLADLARVHVLDRLAQPPAGAALRARLADLVQLAGHFDNAPTLADVVADRLLDVDVLAGLHGPDGGQRVPVVRRGDADDVDALVLEHLADVRLELRGDPLPLLGRLERVVPLALGELAVDVADHGDNAVVLVGEAADVAHAAAVYAATGYLN